MTDRGDSALGMMLIAYERLTDHGLALPLFASSAGANALHIAVPSQPGDPAAQIQSFELYSSTDASALDASQFQTALPGGIWIDVFICDLPPEKWTGLSRSAFCLGGADIAQ